MGAAGDPGLRVQEALSGLSVKRKSGCRRSEIQEVFVLGTVTARLWAGRRGRGHVTAEEGCGEARTGRHRWEEGGEAGPGALGQVERWNVGEKVWTFSSVQRALAPSGEAGA